MNEILQSLRNIGLSDKEAKIYLSLVKFGEATVADIANEASVKRPTTYLILDELRKKGLVINIPHAKKIIFQAKTPDELYDQTISHIKQFEKILPTFRSINPKKEVIKTLYFEGIDGVREAVFYKIDNLKNTTIKGFWAKADKITSATSDLFNKFGDALKTRGVKITGITPDDNSIYKSKENYSNELYDITLVPKEDYSSDVSIEITENFVRIIDPVDLKAIIIENPRITESLSQIFILANKGIKRD